uniref:Uncharacterized protein n=1 Tax=Arundo donax TaxID=35708 RepID=A0A0A9BWQ5_ARUDO
MGIPQHRLEI